MNIKKNEDKMYFNCSNSGGIPNSLPLSLPDAPTSLEGRWKGLLLTTMLWVQCCATAWFASLIRNSNYMHNKDRVQLQGQTPQDLLLGRWLTQTSPCLIGHWHFIIVDPFSWVLISSSLERFFNFQVKWLYGVWWKGKRYNAIQTFCSLLENLSYALQFRSLKLRRPLLF